MLNEGGIEVLKEDPSVEERVFGVVEDVARAINTLADNRKRSAYIEKNARYDEAVRQFAETHPDDTTYTPKLKEVEIYREYCILERDERLASKRFEIFVEEKDEELLGLIAGKAVEVTPHEGADLNDVFPEEDGVLAEQYQDGLQGRVIGASALMGRLIINQENNFGIPSEVTIVLLREDEEGNVSPQVSLRVLNQPID